MSCKFGNKITVTVFGQSHSPMIGAVIDGVPAGIPVDEEKAAAFIARRSAKGETSTARHEADKFRIISGLVNGVTCGAPICGITENADTRPEDYEKLKNIPRPSHGDFAAYMKHGGFNDFRGGGNTSGRMTAALCFAGAICIQLLEAKGITVGAHALAVHGSYDASFDPVNITPEELCALKEKEYPVTDDEALEKMKAEIAEAKARGDSVGGIIECAVTGLEPGIGEPAFDGIENKISAAVFGIPGIKGIEFGSGFAGSALYGSENNDEFIIKDGAVSAGTNSHGGILAGMTSGMPVIFRCAAKPIPSIAKEQKTVDLSEMKPCTVSVGGRHDPCMVFRAVPCVEAAAAIALADLIF